MAPNKCVPESNSVYTWDGILARIPCFDEVVDTNMNVNANRDRKHGNLI
jgi:hypothetical protein